MGIRVNPNTMNEGLYSIFLVFFFPCGLPRQSARTVRVRAPRRGREARGAAGLCDAAGERAGSVPVQVPVLVCLSALRRDGRAGGAGAARGRRMQRARSLGCAAGASPPPSPRPSPPPRSRASPLASRAAARPSASVPDSAPAAVRALGEREIAARLAVLVDLVPNAAAAVAREPALLLCSGAQLAAARRAAEERLRRARPEWEDKRVEEVSRVPTVSQTPPMRTAIARPAAWPRAALSDMSAHAPSRSASTAASRRTRAYSSVPAAAVPAVLAALQSHSKAVRCSSRVLAVARAASPHCSTAEPRAARARACTR